MCISICGFGESLSRVYQNRKTNKKMEGKMSFLLGDFKELNYNELVNINGGQSVLGITSIIDGLFGKTSTTPQGVETDAHLYYTIGTGSIMTSSVGGGSSSCSGKSSSYSNSYYHPGNDNLSTLVPTKTNSCSGAYVAYHSQLMFTDYNLNKGSKFSKTACGTTSLINEISEQYTKETGKTLTDTQILTAVKKAIDAGKIDGTDAFVNDWGGAADVIGKSLGMKGTWSYTTDAKQATATIISIDSSKDNYDGYHNHFVNDIGNGQYYDPYTNEIGNINDLTLTTKWTNDQGIKSAYRYLTYSTKK